MKSVKIISVMIALLTLGTTTKAFGQNKQLISGDFVNIHFDDFVRTIESQSKYHFYYDSLDTDSIIVNMDISNKPLSFILENVFLHTDVHFFIDTFNRVFVIRNIPIQILFSGKGEDSAMKIVSGNRETKFEKESSATRSLLENRLFEIGEKGSKTISGFVTLTGNIRDMNNGDPLAGALIQIDSLPQQKYSDPFGNYSFKMSPGEHYLYVSSGGMSNAKRHIMIYSDGVLNIDMKDYVPTLKVVIVTADMRSNVKSTIMGSDRINIKTIKQMPSVMGEADVLRAVLSLPGVTSVGEGSTGLNVRGGAADQNLILFNDATIYNPSHFFGFFSAFNPDVVKDALLYKSSIPEKYGGRLSSVLDISSREGNKKKFSGQGGLGLLTSRLCIEGPIEKNKASYLVAGRMTYSDWVLHRVPDYSNSSASFYDLNVVVSQQISKHNNLYLTGYLSQDHFRLNNDTTYGYSNHNLNLKWKHVYNDKFFGLFTLGYDSYQFGISSVSNPINAYKFSFNVDQDFLRIDNTYILNSRHTIDFGLNCIYYKLYPGTILPNDIESEVTPNQSPPEQALENSIYVGNQFKVSDNISIQGGLRFTIYDQLGPRQVYTYFPGMQREEINIQDSLNYKSGSIISTYHAPEYRFSARFSLSRESSIKVSANSYTQFIHMLSNTSAISPTDIWKLSDTYIKPTYGQQVSLGFYRNLRSDQYEVSLELYYKTMYNFLDYKSGATLLLNHHIETDIVNTRGRSYGVELFLKRTTGKLNGWISYTYSRTLLQTDDPLVSNPVNMGKEYPSDYDKPNNLFIICNYRFSHRFSISLDMTYATGRPITIPVGEYIYAGSYRVLYSNRNEFRVPDYFRTDFSMNIEGNHKIKQFSHNSWSIGVYNLTGRKNPYSIYFTSESGFVNGYKLSIFGSAIPFVTYNFVF